MKTEIGTIIMDANTLNEATTSLPDILTLDPAKALFLSFSAYIFKIMVIGMVMIYPGNAKSKQSIVMKILNPII